jgi:ribose/xylose/arabinose/galactoside ABC-type transport system permease subunit
VVDSILKNTVAHSVAAREARAKTVRSLGAQWIFRYGMVLGLVALVVVTAILDPSFLMTNNLLNLLRQWAPPGLMAVGMTFVIISGGFDLSVGGTYAAAAVLSASLAASVPIPLAVAASIAMGAGIGLVNGIVITRLEVNPFVATLGMGFIVTGLTEVISNAIPIMVENPAFQILGGGDLWGLPIPCILLIAALLLGGVVLAQSVYGRYVYAIGGGDEASRLTGLRTRTIRTLAYVMTGALAALAGCIIASQLGEGQGDIGVNVELGVITIVIVGGNAVSGGEGAMWRTATGIGILAVLGNAFDHLQVSTFWQEVIEGLIIIAALAIDAYGKRRAQR